MPHLSASQYDVFANCPEKWVEQYCRASKGDYSEALGIGGALHTVLENFGRSRKTMRVAVIEPAVMKREFTMTLRHLLAESDPYGKLAARFDDMEARGHAMLDAFCRDVAPYYWPVQVEEGFDFKLPGVPDYDGEPWTVTGRIDARTLRDDGVVTVDWKTAGKPWRAGIEHGKAQASIYLLSEFFGGQPVSTKVTFVVFSPKKQRDGTYTCEADQRPTTRTVRELSDTLQKLRQAALAINKLRDDYKTADAAGLAHRAVATPTPSYLCPWCPKVERCFEGQQFLYERNRREKITVNPDGEHVGEWVPPTDDEVADTDAAETVEEVVTEAIEDIAS